MGSGKYRERITLLQASVTQNASGQDDKTWNPIAKRRASVKVTGGTERFVSNTQQQADYTHLIEMRFDTKTSTLTPQHRLEWQGRTLEITRAYDPTGRRKSIEIQAIESI